MFTNVKTCAYPATVHRRPLSMNVLYDARPIVYDVFVKPHFSPPPRQNVCYLFHLSFSLLTQITEYIPLLLLAVCRYQYNLALMTAQSIYRGLGLATRRCLERKQSRVMMRKLWFSSYPPHQVVGLPSLSPVRKSSKWYGCNNGLSYIIFSCSLLYTRADHGIRIHRELDIDRGSRI
jgi:hypothetical protein